MPSSKFKPKTYLIFWPLIIITRCGSLQSDSRLSNLRTTPLLLSFKLHSLFSELASIEGPSLACAQPRNYNLQCYAGQALVGRSRVTRRDALIKKRLWRFGGGLLLPFQCKILTTVYWSSFYMINIVSTVITYFRPKNLHYFVECSKEQHPRPKSPNTLKFLLARAILQLSAWNFYKFLELLPAKPSPICPHPVLFELPLEGRKSHGGHIGAGFCDLQTFCAF